MHPSMNESQILKEFERVEGYHLHGALPHDKELPWDRFVEYDKAILLKMALDHAKKMKVSHYD